MIYNYGMYVKIYGKRVNIIMRKLIKKAISILTLTVLIFSLSGCGNSSNKSDAGSVIEQEVKREGAPKIKLDKDNAIPIQTTEDYKNLVEMYKSQKEKVNKEYIGKTFKVSGELLSVETENDHMIVSILADNRIEAIEADFELTEENKEKTMNLKKRGHGVGQDQIGSSISVYGILTKFEDDNGVYIPQINNCEFV